MRHYIVLGREGDAAAPASRSRGEVVSSGARTSERLREAIEHQLQDLGLSGQVEHFGEADAFGAVHLTATPTVAEAIRGMRTLVEGVLEDRSELRFVR